MPQDFIRKIAPLAAICIASGLASGCNIRMDGKEGVPIAELDITGATPSKLTLAGPDSVIITPGETLTVNVEGDPQVRDTLRFALDDEALIISRDNADWAGGKSGKKVTTIRVTMPAPEKLKIAGSGDVAAQTMASMAEVSIAGSGRADIGYLDAQRLDVSIAGSGTLSAAGTAKLLNISIAGSGDLEAKGLSADEVKISILGSGDAEFSSDGAVKADIAGSGDIVVHGRATCSVNAAGSGKVTCKAAKQEDGDSTDE